MKKSVKKLPVAKVTAPATKAPAKKTIVPAKKKSTAEPPATFISAQIDIGFGNHLTIRGEGPGLSWHKGVVMDCVGSGLWTTSIKKASSPVIFKVLVNDLSWNTGGDYIVAPGQSITITPTF
jgi:hypothetical protein